MVYGSASINTLEEFEFHKLLIYLRIFPKIDVVELQ